MWDDNLVGNQEGVISNDRRDSCLLAGPGTGKTFCLARRICYLVEEMEVEPSAILALTFTRAAAAELANRVRNELGDQPSYPVVSTLHSFALSTMLHGYAGNRFPRPIRIADDYEERHIIQEDLKRILNLNEIKDVQKIFKRMSDDWESLNRDDPEWENRFPNPEFLGAWREHRTIYGYVLRSELVYQLKHSLEEGEVEVPGQFDVMLVDEYQDLNACDLAVIKMIADTGIELYAAGDDDQSIYGFRSADPAGIRRFHEDFEDADDLNLELCLRCDRDILAIGQFVARQDPRRLDKVLRCSENAERGEVRLLNFRDQSEEANGIAEMCNHFVNVRGEVPSEILVLLRSDRHGIFSGLIQTSLERAGLQATTKSNPLESLDEIEGRHFICLVKLLANQQDSLAWRVILDVRRNSIGERTFESIYNLANDTGQTFYEAMVMVINGESDLANGLANKVRSEFEIINDLLEKYSSNEDDDLSLVIQTIADEQISDRNIRRKVLNIFDNVFTNQNIEDYAQLLRAINASSGNMEQDRDENSINIMTMHQAKGLSANVVFVVAAEEEYLPGKNVGALRNDERRLLYVSLTRARHHLFITHCNRRTGRQMRSGATAGRSERSLTSFLRGGPVRSIPGKNFIRNL